MIAEKQFLSIKLQELNLNDNTSDTVTLRLQSKFVCAIMSLG